MSKEKLLVLDDEPRILSSLEDLFGDDYEALTTTDFRTALRMAQEQDVAVVLTDERMPEITGHEFLAQLKDVSRATRLLISGYSDVLALEQAVNAGRIYAYVSKPWDPLELKATVGAAMAQFQLVQRIEQERELLRVLMESIPDLIYFKDSDSRFTRINREHARTLGVQDAGEWLGKRDADFLDAEYARQSYRDEQEIVRSGQPLVDRVEKLRKADGRFVWLSTTKVPIFDNAGLVSGIAGISREITDLKDIEEALREQSDHNRLILETANDAFIATDATGSITAWNHQAELTFGWAAEEVMGRPFTDTVLAPAHREAHARGVQRFLRTGERTMLNRRTELDALHRDCHEFPVEVTVWPVRVGETYSFNALVRDIGEKRRAELQAKAIQYAVGRYSSLAVEHAPEGVVIVNREGTMVLVNAQTERLFGYSQEDLLGRPADLLLPERFRPSYTERRATYFSDPKVQSIGAELDLKGLRKDGSEFPVEIALNPIQTDEGVLLVSSVRDATERKEFERMLREKNVELEKASTAKDFFLATMSHELRTPLNAILGFTGTLLMKLPGPLTADQERQLKTVQASGKHLLSLVNDLLDLAKIESGKVEVQLQAASCQEVLVEVVSALRLLAEAKSLRFEAVFPAQPLLVTTDRRALSQIVLNLANNAIKFTACGSVRLEVADAPGDDPPMVAVHVADTGAGIKPENQEKLFRPFERVNGGSRVEGTGLGLYLCRKLAELIGGRIEFESEFGRGSRFTLLIPKG
jgi:PAS domain S-box-containing protein